VFTSIGRVANVIFLRAHLIFQMPFFDQPEAVSGEFLGDSFSAAQNLTELVLTKRVVDLVRSFCVFLNRLPIQEKFNKIWTSTKSERVGKT